MGDEARHRDAGGRTAVEEPFFTEQAEEEARPVVPLGRAGDAGPSYGTTRGRLPRGVNLLLAVILAGAAGAAAGYVVFRERVPQPAAEASAAGTPEPVTSQATVSGGADAPAAEKDEMSPRPELPARVEPERPATNTAGARPRDEGKEQVERAREDAVRERGEEAQPRGEAVAARAERCGRDESRPGRRSVVRRIERRDDDEQGERPKARLVGTITRRSRPY